MIFDKGRIPSGLRVGEKAISEHQPEASLILDQPFFLKIPDIAY